MCSDKTLFVALELELYVNFTCHEIVFLVIHAFPPPTIKDGKQAAGWIWPVSIVGWLLFSSHDLKGCLSVRGKGQGGGGTEAPLLPPHHLLEFTETGNTSPAALALTSKELCFIAWLQPVYQQRHSFNLAICKGLS